MAIHRPYIPVLDSFTQIPNAWLRDGRLSLKARGLLALLTSHRPGWVVTMETLQEENPEGREAIRNAIRELEAHRYLVVEKRHGADGRWTYDYVLTDPAAPVEPVEPDEASSQVEPDTGYPSVANRPHKNTNPKNTSNPQPHPTAPRPGDVATAPVPDLASRRRPRQHSEPVKQRAVRVVQEVVDGDARVEWEPWQAWSAVSAVLAGGASDEAVRGALVRVGAPSRSLLLVADLEAELGVDTALPQRL